jgi:hypothetical protein
MSQRLFRSGRLPSLVAGLALAASFVGPAAADEPWNGLGTGLGTLSRLSKARSRSISPENPTGEPGRGGMATEGTGKDAARELGRGWKVSPSVRIKAKSVFTLADVGARARSSTSG